MATSIWIFWLLAFILLYTYAGYTFLLWITAKIYSWTRSTATNMESSAEELPAVTMVVAAYNEKAVVSQKIANINQLNYPPEKVFQLWVTDGSTDGTEEVLKDYPEVSIIHHTERLGKAEAINRAMKLVQTPVTVFSDANTIVEPNSLIELVKPLTDSKTGGVAGEKRILNSKNGNPTSAGEGIYWRYESFIKSMESATGSTISAAGELFAIKTELFTPIPPDTLLDDFEISSRIILGGNRVKYSRYAAASEYGSLNFSEEMKRKVRIAAGGFQFLFRNLQLLNPFPHPGYTFKYFSHKVLRWAFAPACLFLLPFFNAIIITAESENPFYLLTLVTLLSFFLLGLFGHLARNRKAIPHLMFLPYYAILMNISEIVGFFKFIQHKHNPKWDKSKRET